MSEIRVVCFDLGGVLVRICPTIDDAAARAGIRNGEPDTWHDVDARARRSDVIRRYHRGDLPCRDYYGAFADACVGRYSPAEVESLHAQWILGEYEDVAGVIQRINRIPGVRSACLSNTAHAHWEQMTVSQRSAFPAVNQLQHLMASHLMRMVKPDPEIYQEAAHQLGVAPQQILFFDDLPENVAAAQAAGLNAERLDPLKGTAPQISDVLGRYNLAGF